VSFLIEGPVPWDPVLPLHHAPRFHPLLGLWQSYGWAASVTQ
jgi:hypothetical protein